MTLLFGALLLFFCYASLFSSQGLGLGQFTLAGGGHSLVSGFDGSLTLVEKLSLHPVKLIQMLIGPLLRLFQTDATVERLWVALQLLPFLCSVAQLSVDT